MSTATDKIMLYVKAMTHVETGVSVRRGRSFLGYGWHVAVVDGDYNCCITMYKTVSHCASHFVKWYNESGWLMIDLFGMEQKKLVLALFKELDGKTLPKFEDKFIQLSLPARSQFCN